MNDLPQISIVVPTFNSARRLRALLASIAEDHESTRVEVIVNDDPRTTDDTRAVVDSFSRMGMRLIYLQDNASMAQGRQEGARHATAEILLHLDSDMEVTPGLLGECIARIDGGESDALVIPEVSFGTNFLARSRWLEKQIYDGVDSIESLRCLGTSTYNKVGGHDQRLVFSEDKDLDLRVRRCGARVGRTTASLRHNEGAPTLRDIFRKKRAYLATSSLFAQTHADAYATQVSLARRLKVLFGKPRTSLRHPLLFAGVLCIGATELAALVAGRRAHVRAGEKAATADQKVGAR